MRELDDEFAYIQNKNKDLQLRMDQKTGKEEKIVISLYHLQGKMIKKIIIKIKINNDLMINFLILSIIVYILKWLVQ